jgi:hypothetical protein
MAKEEVESRNCFAHRLKTKFYLNTNLSTSISSGSDISSIHMCGFDTIIKRWQQIETCALLCVEPWHTWSMCWHMLRLSDAVHIRSSCKQNTCMWKEVSGNIKTTTRISFLGRIWINRLKRESSSYKRWSLPSLDLHWHMLIKECNVSPSPWIRVFLRSWSFLSLPRNFLYFEEPTC